MKLIHVLFYNFLALVSLFFMGRLALFLIYFDRFSQSGVNYWLSFVYGLKMDIIVACIILIFPLILLTLHRDSSNIPQKESWDVHHIQQKMERLHFLYK